MGIRIKINVYSRGLHVRVMVQNDRKLLSSFCDKLAVYEERFVRGRGKVRVRTNTYATYHPRTMTYGVHKGLLQQLIEHLKRNGLSSGDIGIDVHEIYEPEAANLNIVDGVSPRDYQEPIVDFMLNDRINTVLPIQTGKGKTFLALYSITKIGIRTSITMGAMHIETWLKDADWIIQDASEKIKVIQGKKALTSAIAEARLGLLDADIIITSVNTIRNYLTEYETKGKSSYGVNPIDLYKVLGVGLRITDEAHECLHFQFRHDIETHVPMTLYLSATISSHDPFINRMYDAIFPVDDRYLSLEWDKYIAVTALSYSLKEPQYAIYKGGNGMYSHTAYENWIMRSPERLNNYLEMVAYILKKGWGEIREPGDKALIFMSTVELCERTAKYLQPLYPDLICNDYTGKHDSPILHNSDIIVSSPGSAGTGKDIKGLFSSFNTIAVNGKQRNIQMLGRLRTLPDGRTPNYYYLVAVNIPKHIQYHKSKLQLFAGLVKTHRTLNTSFKI